MSDQVTEPKSWFDNEGVEWCYECKKQVMWFKEGWICDGDCPAYLASDETGRSYGRPTT